MKWPPSFVLRCILMLCFANPVMSQEKPLDREVSETFIGPYSVRLQQADTVCVSPDIGHITYWDQQGKKALLYIDGKEMPQYAGNAGPCRYSPDSKRFAYVAWRDKKRLIVADAVEISKYDAAFTLAFSPDCKQSVLPLITDRSTGVTEASCLTGNS